MDEFGFIDKIRSSFPASDSFTGIGDDCAVIPQEDGFDTVASTDMLMEGSHFLLADADPFLLGWKSAAVNFSDIAAMGASPLASFLAFSLPEKVLGNWIDRFMAGYREISLQYGFPLLGGDTTSSPDRLCICVTVLGKIPHGRSRLRSAAKPGDLICVTGRLGDSATGLQIVLRGLERGNDENFLVERHYRPTPRIREGMALAGCEGVHAMMDISDGIGSDLRHILKESGVGAEIDTGSIPMSDCMKRTCDRYGFDSLDMAISGGEDYELLFTIAKEAEKSCPVDHYVIGQITEGHNLTWTGSGKDYCGFRHF